MQAPSLGEITLEHFQGRTARATTEALSSCLPRGAKMREFPVTHRDPFARTSEKSRCESCEAQQKQGEEAHRDLIRKGVAQISPILGNERPNWHSEEIVALTRCCCVLDSSSDGYPRPRSHAPRPFSWAGLRVARALISSKSIPRRPRWPAFCVSRQEWKRSTAQSWQSNP